MSSAQTPNRISKLKIVVAAEILLVLAVIAAIAVFAIRANNDDPENVGKAQTDTQNLSSDPNPNLTRNGAVQSQTENVAYVETYKKVLENPAGYPMQSASETVPNGEYTYAMTEATGDSTPELLLRVGGSEIAPVIVFTTDKSGNLVQIRETLADGAASAGGSRVSLQGSKSGQGIYQIDSHSLKPTSANTQFLIDGTSLVKGRANSLDMSESDPDHMRLTWLDTSDVSGLENYSPGANTTGNSNSSDDNHSTDVAGPAPSTSSSASSDAAQASNGQLKLTGTVVRWSTSQALKGFPAPNGEPESNDYIMLILDQPTTVTAMKTNTASSQNVTEALLGSREDTPYGQSVSSNYADAASHEGQRVTVTISESSARYPSDASVPLGGLRIVDYDSIEAA